MEKGSGDEDIIKVNQSALSKTKVKEAYLSTHHSPLITHYSLLIAHHYFSLNYWSVGQTRRAHRRQ